MNKFFFLILFCLTANLLIAQPSLEVKTLKLDNGLTVWLNEDHTLPTVFGGIVVKAGSKDCPGTGIAHYFEHIMFKGTDKIGTTDYGAEKIVLDSIAEQYDKLAETEDTALRNGIQKEINRLSIAAARYAIPNEFARLISLYGGSGLNASTSYDYTTYYNCFAPQYMEQWLELNSERLLHPIFRLFQNELETVYEEKNMYADNLGNSLMENIMNRFFTPHPYKDAIIGTSENLKNPRLSEMEKFFRKYYTANNMGLILCGNFNSEDIIPLIREKFSRLPAGTALQDSIVNIPDFAGREMKRILFPIPILKLEGATWRGVPANHPDQNALKLATRLLNNSNGTGYLDQLVSEGQVMEATSETLSLNEAGAVFVIVLPKLLFQSYEKAEQLVFHEIERIKKGDFNEEMLHHLKLELIREHQMAMENPVSRAVAMMTIFSQNGSWDNYLQEIQRMNALTKEDVIKIANTYFTSNYLVFRKKTGSYPKDRINKPNFEKVIPEHRGESSAYAQHLEKSTDLQTTPRIVDFAKDADMFSLSPLVTLYTKENPINDIFQLTLSYKQGCLENPALSPLSEYLYMLGTDSLSFKDFQNRLQALGATLKFDVTDRFFRITLCGFDQHFEEAVALTGSFIQQVKPDNTQFKKMIEDMQVGQKMRSHDPEKLANALFEYVVYGDQSKNLKELNSKDVKGIGADGLVSLFKKLQQVSCDIHYSGKSESNEVIAAVEKYLDPANVSVAAPAILYRTIAQYEKPKVFFIDNPKARQSIVYSYTPGQPYKDRYFRDAAIFFDTYFGSDMFSLLFQEIREFRSYAYYAASRYYRPSPTDYGKRGYLQTFLSTQGDKTIDALSVLDSLLKDMPLKQEKMAITKQAIRNEINNSYAPFREISQVIADARRVGYTENANQQLAERLDSLSMEDLVKFYKDHIQHQTTCYIIMGNSKHIDMKKLAQFGEVVPVKEKVIFH